MVNEFLASSETCCGTELFGSGEDFVELYNHGSEPVNIYGWGFSDTDGTVATTAPDTVIQPGEFLVLWFTGDANGFPEIDSKLSSDGETIYAADSSGTAVFSLDFGVQDEDVSYGRYPDGSDSWQQMNPTPGVTNTNELGLDDDVTIPEQYTLHQNYPNPFNPRTSIRYDLPDNERVNIIIYDMLGRQVKQLVDEYQDAGFKSIIWDATNDFGKPAATGVYLCKIQAGEYMQTKKMVLLK